jgi:hypothetical protein
VNLAHAGLFLETTPYTGAMAPKRIPGLESNFGVISVRPRELKEVVDYSEQENVDAFWENARRSAQIERLQRNGAAHGVRLTRKG